jgi:hypothetical protein
MAETLARREQGDALSTILGTGDTRAALAQVERNVRDIIDVARSRGFITTLPKQDGSKVDFYGFPTWQLLGMTYGVTPLVESLEPIDGGYKAKAVAQTRDGAVVGAAFGLCRHQEYASRRKKPTDHDVAAMAQTRAMRNALRSALGAALVLAGFDFPDPDAPATKDQVGVLHQLERELDWSHELGHEMAGVESYKDLTREQAATFIDRWTEMRDSEAGGSAEDGEAHIRAEDAQHGANRGEAGKETSTPSPAEPLAEESASVLTEARNAAIRKYGKPSEVERACGGSVRFAQMTVEQLREVLA